MFENCIFTYLVWSRDLRIRRKNSFKSAVKNDYFNILTNWNKQYTQKRISRFKHFRALGLSIVFSKCLLRHGVLRVFVSFSVLVFVRAILSVCP